jgi:lipopolysaccharide export system permease protein
MRRLHLPWRLYRYILREHIGPFLFALLVATLVLLLGQVFKMMELILTKGVPGQFALELFVLYLPAVIAYDMPMALMVGALMAFGRLSSDSEITAMKATGTSFLSLLMPGLVLSIVFAVGMYFFNDQVLPEANHRFKNLLFDIQNKRPDISLRPGVFITDFPGYVIYIDEMDDQDMTMTGVKINIPRGGRLEKYISADYGHLETGEGGVIRLDLSNGEIHIKPGSGDSFQTIAFDNYVVEINANTELAREEREMRSDREMNVAMMTEKVNEYLLEAHLLYKVAEIRKEYLAAGLPPPQRHEQLQLLKLAIGGYTAEEVRRLGGIREPVERRDYSPDSQANPLPGLDFRERESIFDEEEMSLPELGDARGAPIGYSELASEEASPAPASTEGFGFTGSPPEGVIVSEAGSSPTVKSVEVAENANVIPAEDFRPQIAPPNEETLTPAEIAAREERYLATRQRTLESEANRYTLEIAKKFSISFACIAFLLVGSPLGVMIRRSGKGIGFVTSIGFFLFYWIGLVGGEALGDSGVLNPWLAMWLPNLVFLGLAIIFIYRAVNDVGPNSRGLFGKLAGFFRRLFTRKQNRQGGGTTPTP